VLLGASLAVLLLLLLLLLLLVVEVLLKWTASRAAVN
jgi:hypothetical protein